MDTARSLVTAEYTLEFIARSEEERLTSADRLIAGEFWGMKAPKSDKASAIDKNVRKALHQARCVILDSRRMKRISNKQVEHELKKCAESLPGLKHLLFANRYGEVLDIK